MNVVSRPFFFIGTRFAASSPTQYFINYTQPTEGTFMENCGQVGLAVTSIASLSHLNGETVSILADGFVLEQQVVSGGTVTLPAYYTTVHIGLPYTAQLQPVNVEAGLPDGTLQGRQVNITKLMLKVWNSAGGKCGPDFDNLQDIKELQRSNLINKYGVRIYTGDVPVIRGGGYQASGSICIQQDDPLPMTVTAMVMEVQPGNMINMVN